MPLPLTTAVLAIDLQNGLFGRDRSVHDAAGVLKRAALVIEAGASAERHVVLVQDDAGPALWEPETAGWELHERVPIPSGAMRLRKTFGDAFRGTSLDADLRDRGVTGIVVLGAMTDFSVRSTLQRALLVGYSVTLVRDAHSTLDSVDATAVEHIAVLNREIDGGEERRLPVRARAAEEVVRELVHG